MRPRSCILLLLASLAVCFLGRETAGPNPVITSWLPASQHQRPQVLYGCTDSRAVNFRSNADVDRGDCIRGGCIRASRSNFDSLADVDDGTCAPVLQRCCTNSRALNYNFNCGDDDGTCIVIGCTDSTSAYYDASAAYDDGCSCGGDCSSHRRELLGLCCPLAQASNHDPTCFSFTTENMLSCQWVVRVTSV